MDRMRRFAGLSQFLSGPGWLRGLMAVALAIASASSLPAAYSALRDAVQLLHGAYWREPLLPGFAALHTEFGTPAQAVDVAVGAIVVVVLASGARVPWVAHAYGATIVVTLVLTIAAPRFRRGERAGGSMPYRSPLHVAF